MGVFQLEGYALTHEGNVRGNNEDNFYLFGTYKKDVNEKRMTYTDTASCEDVLVAVYDGMGGEEAGEVASLTAAENTKPCTFDSIEKNAVEQLISINDIVCEKIRDRGSRMGTTAVQLFFGGGKARCVNIGDSRAYLLRDGWLKQLSVDHSEGQRMIDMGIKTPEEARKSKNWHELTQHIGIFPEEFGIEPYVGEEIELQKGDLFLLASDGLTDMLEDEQIKEVIMSLVEKGNGLKEAAEKLLENALANGGKDNTTIVLVRVNEEEKDKQKDKQSQSIEEKKDNKSGLFFALGVLAGVVCLLIVYFVMFQGKGNTEKDTTISPTGKKTVVSANTVSGNAEGEEVEPR